MIRRFLEWLAPDGDRDDWLEPDRHDESPPPDTCDECGQCGERTEPTAR